MANLKDILLKLGLNLAQGAGEGAFASLSPEAYHQAQITKRHSATLAAEDARAKQAREQQWNLHNTPSAYQLAEMDRWKSLDEAQRQEQEQRTAFAVAQGVHNGSLRPLKNEVSQEVVQSPQAPLRDVQDNLTELFNLPSNKTQITYTGAEDPSKFGVLGKLGMAAVPPNRRMITPDPGSILARLVGTGKIDTKDIPPAAMSAMVNQMGHQDAIDAEKKLVKEKANIAKAQISLLIPDTDSSKKYYLTALDNANTEAEVKGVMQGLLKRQEMPNTVPELAVWISDPKRTPEELKQGKTALALLAEQAKAGRTVSVYAGQEVEPYVQGLAAGALTPAQVPAALRDKVLKETQARGINVVSDLERKELMQGKKAKPILDSIAALSEKINTQQGVIAKIGGVVERGKAMANLNDDVSEYEALVSGFTPLVARAVGHTGVLTEQDVKSVKAMFPRPEDSKSLRDRKTARLLQVFGGVQQAVTDTITQPIKSGSGRKDPLGILKPEEK